MRTRIILFLAIALFTWSCEQDPIDDNSLTEAETEEITTEVEVATVEDLIQDTEEETDRLVSLRSDSASAERCATVTRVPEAGFPATTTIDFGEGCEGPNGRIRAGQIIVRQTDSLHVPGAERLLTFNGFSVDAVQIEGSRLLTNLGLNDKGQPTWKREIQDALITFPDGTSLTWTSEYTRTQVSGFRSQARLDDIFITEGFTQGENRNGVSFSHVIAEPLVKSRDCRWIQAGVLEVTRGERMRTVSFGNGMCDRVATITFPNGQTRRILLDHQWWDRKDG